MMESLRVCFVLVASLRAQRFLEKEEKEKSFRTPSAHLG